MCCLNIVRVIVPPCSAHSLWLFLVGHHIAVIGEFLRANRTYPVLLTDLSVEQLSHLCWRPKLAIASRVMRVFNTLHPHPDELWLGNQFPPTARNGSMNRTQLVTTKSHGISSHVPKKGSSAMNHQLENLLGCYNSCPRDIDGKPGERRPAVESGKRSRTEDSGSTGCGIESAW